MSVVQLVSTYLHGNLCVQDPASGGKDLDVGFPDVSTRGAVTNPRPFKYLVGSKVPGIGTTQFIHGPQTKSQSIPFCRLRLYCRHSFKRECLGVSVPRKIRGGTVFLVPTSPLFLHPWHTDPGNDPKCSLPYSVRPIHSTHLNHNL